MAAAAPPSRTVETRTGPLPCGADWEALVAEDRPVLFKGAAADWPLVRAGLSSDEEAAAMLVAGWSGQPVVVYRGAPEIGGRFAYTPAVDGFNFAASREPLDAVLEEILALRADAAAPSIYVGSTDLGIYFPALEAAIGLDLASIHPTLVENPGLASVWLGNRTTATCHYDDTHNIAVCAVGHRRFTLFPPEQAANLYPGPLEPTPGGRSSRWSTSPRPISRGIRASRARSRRCKLPRWSPAIYSPTRRCGGTTSRRWTVSTRWSISGGTRCPAMSTARK